jgi:5'-3' exonuclease
MGDSVDNIPGVDKCGPKTAAKWLAEHGTLDAVIENAPGFSGKIGENLRAALAAAAAEPAAGDDQGRRAAGAAAHSSWPCARATSSADRAVHSATASTPRCAN